MPISLRIPARKEELIKKIAKKTGKTKSAVIMEAVDEKIGTAKDRKTVIRNLAGWMSPEEAEALRQAVGIFDQINTGDWE